MCDCVFVCRGLVCVLVFFCICLSVGNSCTFLYMCGVLKSSAICVRICLGKRHDLYF